MAVFILTVVCRFIANVLKKKKYFMNPLGEIKLSYFSFFFSFFTQAQEMSE